MTTTCSETTIMIMSNNDYVGHQVQFSIIEVLVAMLMTQWFFRISLYLAVKNVSAIIHLKKMLVMHSAIVQWRQPEFVLAI